MYTHDDTGAPLDRNKYYWGIAEMIAAAGVLHLRTEDDGYRAWYGDRLRPHLPLHLHLHLHLHLPLPLPLLPLPLRPSRSHPHIQRTHKYTHITYHTTHTTHTHTTHRTPHTTQHSFARSCRHCGWHVLGGLN